MGDEAPDLEELAEREKLQDPGLHVELYCVDLLDQGGLELETIVLGVTLGLAELLRTVDEPRLLSHAIALQADELALSIPGTAPDQPLDGEINGSS